MFKSTNTAQHEADLAAFLSTHQEKLPPAELPLLVDDPRFVSLEGSGILVGVAQVQYPSGKQFEQFESGSDSDYGSPFIG